MSTTSKMSRGDRVKAIVERINSSGERRVTNIFIRSHFDRLAVHGFLPAFDYSPETWTPEFKERLDTFISDPESFSVEAKTKKKPVDQVEGARAMISCAFWLIKKVGRENVEHVMKIALTAYDKLERKSDENR